VSVVNDGDATGGREIKHLRDALPKTVELCVGGRGAAHCKKALHTPGIKHVDSLEELDAMLVS
jgi:hypothetical protein